MNEFEKWLKEELDDLSHSRMFTADREGTMAKARRGERKDTLIEVAEVYGLDYEHEPETCDECQELREWMEGDDTLLDWDEERIQEDLERHGVYNDE